MRDDQPVGALRRGDTTGLALFLIWQVEAGLVSAEEAAHLLGVTPRTVLEHCVTYAHTADSLDLIDRRHFNPGQQTAYRMEAHRAALVAHWTRNLVNDQSTSGRYLAAQLGGVVNDRTVDRHLNEMGLRAAEAGGLRAEIQAVIATREQAAYWAGVNRQPLAGICDTPPTEEGWAHQVSPQATTALATAHLARNGAYASLKGLVADWCGEWSLWHALLSVALVTGGASLNWLRHLDWAPLVGLLGGQVGPSLSHLRTWLKQVTACARQPVAVTRSDGQMATITALQDYQERAVAQRVQRGLVRAESIRLDCYVNAVFRREPIARAWHGTRNWAFKAFRRNIAQDTQTGHAVTCPLSASNVTPLVVLQQVQAIINGGLDRVRPGVKLRRVVADRWWSVQGVIRYVLADGLQLLCWARSVKSTLTAMAQVDEADPAWQPVTRRVSDPTTGQEVEEVVGYRLEIALQVYGLDQPVRAIVDWDGQPGSRKRARLAIGLAPTELTAEAVSDQLRYRQRVEILLKCLLRRADWSHFGGGPVVVQPVDESPLTEAERKRLAKHRQQVTTRQTHVQARLSEVEAELDRLTAGGAGTRSGVLGLSIPDLRSVVNRLSAQVRRAGETLAGLNARLAQGNATQTELAPRAELDLTQESLLTQLKLDVFTAQETLVTEFIEVALKPALREEAKRQAAERQRGDKRSQSRQHPGAPLCTDVERLFQTKVANLVAEARRASALKETVDNLLRMYRVVAS